MTERREFRPDWCMAPDAPLREWMADNNLRLSVLAVMCAGRARRDEAMALIQEVLDRKPLLPLHAEMLARGTGVSVKFWLAYEHNYRAGLAAGLTDVSESQKEAQS